jgi:hypothetical protein
VTRRCPEVLAPASAGAFLTVAPWLAQAAGAGTEYGLCGAATACAGLGAIPFALETREAPTVVALAGLGATAWGSFTAWACWSDASSLANLAIGTFLSLASAAAGSVVAWRRQGTPIERTRLDLERLKLEAAQTARDTRETPVKPGVEPWPELSSVKWEEPARLPGTTDPIDVGNGIRLPLVGGHVIIGGTTGAGKSVFIACAIADLLPREHMRITVIDPKGDVLLGMLMNSDVVMGDCDSAEALMIDHLTTMNRRGDMNRAAADAFTRGVGPVPTQDWIPTAEEPWDVVIVDEFTDFAGTPVMEIIVEMARKSRALGQTLILATQALDAALFKTEKSTSGGGPRSQFDTRVGGRVGTTAEAEKIFGDGEGKVWAANRLPGKGHVLVKSSEQREPVMRRAPFMDLETLAAWARKCANRPQGVDKPVDKPFIPAQRKGSHLALVKPGPVTQADAVMAFLEANGSSSVASISGGTGVAAASLRSVLRRLAEDGCVVKQDGLWKPLEGP